ncbi:MAG: hypothetical protein Ct9H300mP28_18690 [Pseudomonadota bacterium]|nr:MAG: hypothetical protein Ct9H300mP28_18690 [Pseudomonadota bacterium]
MVEQLPPNAVLRLHVEGESIEGNLVSKMVVLPRGELAPGKNTIKKSWMELRQKKRDLLSIWLHSSLAQKAGIDFDWEILSLKFQPTVLPSSGLFAGIFASCLADFCPAKEGTTLQIALSYKMKKNEYRSFAGLANIGHEPHFGRTYLYSNAWRSGSRCN